MESKMSRTRKRPHYSSSSPSQRYGTMSTIRAGKWTSDEEALASKLIYEFEIGALRDCEEGATLRSYLARKLNCAPMRISKKFAGQCIGKHIYCGRNVASPQNATPKPKTKKARPTLPTRSSTRYRQTPDSYSSSSMIYNYHGSSSSGTTSDAEDNNDDDDYDDEEADNNRRDRQDSGAFSPTTTQELDFGKRLRVVGDIVKRTTKKAYLFTPIRPQPISPGAVTSSAASSNSSQMQEHTDFVVSAQLNEFDLDHSMYGTFGATCGVSAVAASGEPEEWRDVLIDLFGRADSESPTHEDEIFYNSERSDQQQEENDEKKRGGDSSHHRSKLSGRVAGRKEPLLPSTNYHQQTVFRSAATSKRSTQTANNAMRLKF